jgi:tetratricopeptide (TPR) repeat protein
MSYYNENENLDQFAHDFLDFLKRCWSQFSVWSLQNRARLDALAFRYNDALADMNAALKIAPNSPVLYLQRGQVYLLLYEWDKVLADYNTALELDPDYADAFFYRGILYYTRNVPQAALADFARYQTLASNGVHAAEAAKYADQIRKQLAALNS